MAQKLTEILDLNLAWKRVKRDIERNRVFVKHPYEILLIEQDLEGWLNNLNLFLEENKENIFTPSSASICEIPKPKSGIRPGAHLVMEDRIVYAACVEAAYTSIYKTLEWSQGCIDYNYIDYHFHSEGIIHTRWVDDFRIFCRSLPEARQIIVFLTHLLRERPKFAVCKN